MLSVIIETLNSERPLACTLSGLVPAVVEGLLRRVTVIDHGSGDGTALVAEGAGCAFHGLAERDVALNGIRTDWVLFLKPVRCRRRAGGRPCAAIWKAGEARPVSRCPKKAGLEISGKYLAAGRRLMPGFWSGLIWCSRFFWKA